MTTKRQIRTLLKPLLARHPELIAVDSRFNGVDVVLAPVRHIVRGFSIQSSGFADSPQQKWFLGYTCRARAPLITLGDGRFTAERPEEARWSHPRRQDAFIEIVENDVLPLLTRINTIENYILFEPNLSAKWTGILTDPMTRVHVYAALGCFDMVAEAALLLSTAGYRSTPFWSEQTYLEVMEQLLPLTEANDRTGVAALLHDWERQFVEAHGLRAVYEKTPFSFEKE